MDKRTMLWMVLEEHRKEWLTARDILTLFQARFPTEDCFDNPFQMGNYLKHFNLMKKKIGNLTLYRVL